MVERIPDDSLLFDSDDLRMMHDGYEALGVLKITQEAFGMSDELPTELKVSLNYPMMLDGITQAIQTYRAIQREHHTTFLQTGDPKLQNAAAEASRASAALNVIEANRPPQD